MKGKLKLSRLVFAVLLLVLPVVSYGQIITIAISGQITGVSDQYGHLENKIHIGDTITGTYTYESTTLDSNPSPNLGDYVWETPSAGIWLSIGGFDFWTNPSQVSFHIGVYKDSLEDQLVIASSQNLPLSNGTLVQYISWQLNDPTGTALSSDALPLTAPDLSKWNNGDLSITGPSCGPQYYGIAANITSAVLVPEPATLLLTVLGLIVIRKHNNLLNK